MATQATVLRQARTGLVAPATARMRSRVARWFAAGRLGGDDVRTLARTTGVRV